MATLAQVRHISISIPRPPAEVYAYCVDPHNLPRWATGLASDVRFDGDTLIARSPVGDITVRFAPRNEHFVLDHRVTLGTGETFDNPMRVLANRDGSEVVFSLFRQSHMSDAEFDHDAATIAGDLNKLAQLLAA